jgi:cellulose synthase/poly-beta-1,6-N-acetylglucosamine synthase-like glycosyltransferase
MRFTYSKKNLTDKDRAVQRALEILPGMTSWTIIAGMVYLCVARPVIAAILIITFYFYWLLRLLYMTIFLALSYYRLKVEQKTDWMQRVNGIDALDGYMTALKEKTPGRPFRERLSVYLHRKELRPLCRNHPPPPLSKDIYHLVIYPIVKESKEIVEPAIQSLSGQTFPSSRILVVFALEGRADEHIKKEVILLEKKYKKNFWDVLTVVHPSGIPGEARVKGANVTWAAKHAREFFRERNILDEHIIVSCFDADTIVSPHYFACLTYYFMVSPQRLQSSFQPIPVYHNNIWDVPGFARVIETGSSFFQLIEATNPEKLVTFSSHSMSFKALVDAGYWPVDMISDDSAIYWKCLLHFDGRYYVVPMYMTLSMDIAGSDRFWETARSVYKQKRRWAWGVENFPIVTRAFLGSNRISFYDKLRHSFKLFESHISWATWGFLLSFIGWIPALFAGRGYLTSVVYYNTPRVTGTIFQLAAVSLLTSILISINLLPKRKPRLSLGKKLMHAAEWFLIPVILVIFSALPALDAQTRLMFGRYMEFWVTDKKRKEKKQPAAITSDDFQPR